MDLDNLTLKLMREGYTAAADGALVNPNGFTLRGPVKRNGNFFLPEEIGWRILKLQMAKAGGSSSKRELIGPVPTFEPRRL